MENTLKNRTILIEVGQGNIIEQKNLKANEEKNFWLNDRVLFLSEVSRTLGRELGGGTGISSVERMGLKNIWMTVLRDQRKIKNKTDNTEKQAVILRAWQRRENQKGSKRSEN